MKGQLNSWWLAFAAFAIAGCAGVQEYRVLKPTPSIASQYRLAPTPAGAWDYFGFHYHDGLIWVSTIDGLHALSFESFEGDLTRYDLSGMSTITPDRFGDFAVTPLNGSGEVLAMRFKFSAPLMTWQGSDFVSSDFDFEGDTWYGASYSTLGVQKPEAGVKETRFEENLFDGQLHFIPGAFGRLAVHWTESKFKAWIDPKNGQRIADIPPMPVDSSFFIDQGHLLESTKNGVRDHGRLTTAPVRSSRKEFAGYSPWNLSRSADKRTLEVESIYSDGKSYVLRDGPNWSQSTMAFGHHSLIRPLESGDIEVYDLRTGKRALTITLPTKTNPNYKIVFADGRIHSAMNSTISPDEVQVICDDLFDAGFDEREY